jgi:hypothetical protein
VAEGDRTAPRELRREERLAETIVARFELRPPIDIESLARKFAELEYDNIPGSCDGLILGLEGRRKKPLILVDSTPHETRRRFTIAHEIGHLLMPWHLGDFACATEKTRADLWQSTNEEPEANRFAAELLIPSGWLDELIAGRGDDKVGDLVRAVLSAGVSTWVASFRLAEKLPRGHIFAVLDTGRRVILSGETQGTGIGAPVRGSRLDRRQLDRFAAEVEEIKLPTRRIVWWTFRDSGRPADPDRDSRALLEELARRYAGETRPERKIKESLAGILGYANSRAKLPEDRKVGSLYARFRSRFVVSRELPDGLLEDPDFELWLQARAHELGE